MANAKPTTPTPAPTTDPAYLVADILDELADGASLQDYLNDYHAKGYELFQAYPGSKYEWKIILKRSRP